MYKTAKKRHVNYNLQNDLAKIKDALALTTQHAKGLAGQAISRSFDDVKEKSADLSENVTDYVSDKPYKSLGIAVLAGVVFGFILRHK